MHFCLLVGITRDRKRIARPNQLSSTEFQELIASLKKDRARALAELLTHLHPRRGPYLAPQPYRAFMSELARNSPVCGLLQVSTFATLCQVNAIVHGVVY